MLQELQTLVKLSRHYPNNVCDVCFLINCYNGTFGEILIFFPLLNLMIFWGSFRGGRRGSTNCMINFIGGKFENLMWAGRTGRVIWGRREPCITWLFIFLFFDKSGAHQVKAVLGLVRLIKCDCSFNGSINAASTHLNISLSFSSPNN